MLLPMFMAPVIVGLLGRFLTDSTYGLYAWFLRETGIYTGDILGSTTSAFLAVTLMDVWEWTPLIALIVLAGLTSVPKPVLEAAAMDGAGYFKRLRYIVLPMIAGVLIVALLIRSMDAIRYFDIITNTTNGGPADATKIVPIRLYETAFRFFDLGYAAAIGLSMLVVTIIMANVFLGILKRRGLAKMKNPGRKIGLPVVLAVIMLWTLVPIIWMVAVLAQAERGPDGDAAEGRLLADARPLPRRSSAAATTSRPYIGNSIVAAGASTIIAVVLGCLGGYGLARSSFRGKDNVAFWIISQRMAPIAAVVLPLFVIFRFTGLLGSTWGLIVAYLTFNLPFAIWIMNAFFAELPKSLEEAAMVDGASRWMSFRRIALPLALPGVATTAILCLVFSWNDYAFAVTFSGPESQTLPIAASQLVTQTSIDWGQLTAIGTIVVAPMILVGLIVRKWLVTGPDARGGDGRMTNRAAVLTRAGRDRARGALGAVARPARGAGRDRLRRRVRLRHPLLRARPDRAARRARRR